MKKLIITVSIVVAIAIFVTAAAFIKDKVSYLAKGAKKIGGACSYAEYEGVAVITEVKKTEQSKVR